MDLTVSDEYHETRLDRFLRNKYPGIARASLFRLTRKGKIRVNAKRKKPDYRLKTGDIVTVPFAEPPGREQENVTLPEREVAAAGRFIVYENEQLLVCDKPPGVVMHRGSAHAYGLVELLRAYTGNDGLNFVNRLDKETSGLVLAAKSLPVTRSLTKLIREKGVEKYYAVLVHGLAPQDRFTLSSYLRKEQDAVRKIDREDPGAKKAVSSFTVLERRKSTTLLEARLLTGRTHQLRVQLADAGHPIVGDKKYGRPGKRMFLFSKRIVIPSLEIDIEMPLPDFF